jgi:2-keto-4-pentenoate hydratase/2-oxohepta-3-ene-1,7-dioic acid hydratase in catechol pathway
MRIANLAGRLVIVEGDRALDVERASSGTFSADPQAVFDRWDEFVRWAPTAVGERQPFDRHDLEAPVPRPRQLFAIGLNYRDHAAEVGLAPDLPVVFTKFVSSITGPDADVVHPGGDVDWEVELVVVIGRPAWRVDEADAWSHVAGLTGGQDLSERITQHLGTVPQFSMGKSFPGFTPMGPYLVTLDEFDDPDDIALECVVNGDVMQSSRTSMMISSIPRLISQLSAITTLLPGDAIYTGTPSGVGLAMKPPRFLSVGDEILTRFDVIGDLHTRMVAEAGVR